MLAISILSNFQSIIWDFDGVIKDSIEAKSIAFENLFSPYGVTLTKKIKKHHESNGGMSRYEKLPLYLKWAGCESSQTINSEYLERFSNYARKGVVESEWVPGVLSYLKNNYQKKFFYLVTATPQLEIEYILDELGIASYFDKIIGAPVIKNDALKSIISEFSLDTENSVMIGDSVNDYEASKLNNISFVLRITAFNGSLLKKGKFLTINNFENE